MEQQSKELVCKSSPVAAMRNTHAAGRKDGVALVIVLGFLVLITVLIVAFYTSVTTEYTSAKTYASGANTRFLTDSAVNLVMGQIAKATQSHQTGSGATYTWASQPGMIRTWSDAFAGASTDPNRNWANCYKLYSSDSMVINEDPATMGATIAKDVPDGWQNQPATYTDLNAPVTDAGGKLNFPIIDGNLKLLNVNGARLYTYDDNNDGIPDIEGFGIPKDVAEKNYVPGSAISASNNPAAMPVQWLYILKDGTLTAPDKPNSGAALSTQATWKNTTDQTKVPSAANPIVGRIAFWTDDETCKLNVNTASEGDYYSFPHVNSQTDILSKTKTTGYAVAPPATGEYNRYPGHPATTCLSVALGTYLDSGGSVVPSAYSSTASDAGYLAGLQRYMTLLPRYEIGGSKAGTVQATSYNAVSLDTNRLFASVDELMFDPKRNPTPNLSNTDLERLKFFLTANSRAPELTPFNTPKVSMWPQWSTQSDRTAYQGATQKLLAFCSSFGDPTQSLANTSPASQQYEYFFQRNNAKSTGGLPPSYQSTTLDWTVNRNQKLAGYLYKMGAANVPGYGGAFVGLNKYTLENYSNIVLDSLDFIRSNIAKMDYITPSGASEVYIAPLVVQGGLPGAKLGVTMKGFGDFPVITQVALGQGNTNIGTGPIPTAFLIFDTFFPSLTLPGANPGLNVDVDNVAALGIPSLTTTGTYQIRTLFDWHNNKTEAMRGWGWAMSVPNSKGQAYYSFDTKKSTVTLGSAAAAPVTFKILDGQNQPVQKITMRFVQMDVPTPDPKATMPTPWYYYPVNFGTGSPVSSMFSLTNSATLAPIMCSARGVECVYNNKIKGDYRMLAAIYDWAASNPPPTGSQSYNPATELFGATAGALNAPSVSQIHSLRMDDPYYVNHEPTYVNGVLNPATTKFTGSLVSPVALKNTDYQDYQAPFVPQGLQGAQMASGAPGDWDTGPGLQPDGPFINPTQQTFDISAGWKLYFEPDTVSGNNAGVSFSPNRLVASPVKFGSLPTGVSALNPKPWQTLLFCPNPAARQTAATGTAGEHIGFMNPPDSAYLEFFTMPTVEPYAISEPLSTAGKVNLNYQMEPFVNIERSTALRGVLKNTLMVGISAYDVASNAAHPTPLPSPTATYKYNATGVTGGNAGKPGTANEVRYDINRDATVAGIDTYFFGRGTYFKYPSEICSVFLVPQKIPNASYNGSAMPCPTNYKDMMTWWMSMQYGGSKSAMSLTGDNLREEPYDRLYPRLTTKSNTYTVHYRVQMLQKRPVTPTVKADVWEEGKDQVVAESRGSTLIERYVDPSDPAFNSAWDANTLNLALTSSSDSADLSLRYRFRVVSTKKFAP